jgi:hypothetical protein
MPVAAGVCGLTSLLAGARVPARAVTIDRAVAMLFTVFHFHRLTGDRLGKNHRAVDPAHCWRARPHACRNIDRAVSMPFTLFQLYQLTGNRLGKNHRAVNPAHDAGSSGGL